ncbi:MAG TPA: glutathione peroxidase [Ignavibacteria bacterium]|nr:glutathione peroxidase [Ignavibacteria bacterium]
MFKYIFVFSAIFLVLGFSFNKKGDSVINNIHDIKVKNINGEEVSLSKYEGKVLLIVNVASKCGYTKQYAGLQELYTNYRDKGFEILAFPCNDFGGQEPGTNEEIEEFCSSTFGVEFPLFDKIKVLGEDREPLYEKLINNPTTEQGDVKWNFEKFLIAKNGDVVARYRSKVEPLSDEIVNAVEIELVK